MRVVSIFIALSLLSLPCLVLSTDESQPRRLGFSQHSYDGGAGVADDRPRKLDPIATVGSGACHEQMGCDNGFLATCVHTGTDYITSCSSASSVSVIGEPVVLVEGGSVDATTTTTTTTLAACGPCECYVDLLSPIGAQPGSGAAGGAENLNVNDCPDSFVFSRGNPFAAFMDVEDIPQFVTITFDDSITPQTMDYMKPLANIQDARGCHLKATFFVSIEEPNTKCELVQGLTKGLHEIATHTLNHIGFPDVDEITGAIDYLVDQCGVDRDEIQGFRAPFLQCNEDTLNNLVTAGLTYDSSFGTADYAASSWGSDNYWPFTYDEESLSQFQCDNCNVDDPWAPKPGLWEIPMQPLFNADNTPQIPMDYTGNNPMALLQDNFQRRYHGNRAPLGLFFHAGWLQTNGPALKEWIESVLATYDDVFFVTNQELLEWIRNPVPKQDFQQDCIGQEVCFPPSVQVCLFGTFNPDTCRCECNPAYCRGADGSCNTAAATGPCYGEDGAPPVPSTSAPATPVVAPTATPVAAPVAVPVAAPVATAPANTCCPTGFTGTRAFDSCLQYYQCLDGIVTGIPRPCPAGTLFQESSGQCNWPDQVNCVVDTCGGDEEGSPTTPAPQATPVTAPTATPVAPPSPVPVPAPVAVPIAVPTLAPVITAAPTISEEEENNNNDGCCSQDYKTCGVGWCGTDQAGCEACNQWGAGYAWLPQGAATTDCLARYGACSNGGGGSCCPGLTCVEQSVWYSSCQIPS